MDPNDYWDLMRGIAEGMGIHMEKECLQDYEILSQSITKAMQDFEQETPVHLSLQNAIFARRRRVKIKIKIK